jgi:hypothetical protein
MEPVEEKAQLREFLLKKALVKLLLMENRSTTISQEKQEK